MFNATPILRLYAKRRLAQLNAQRPRETQGQELQKLVHKAAATRFGRDHGFAKIHGVKDFQARVPLRTFSDMDRDYWGGTFPLSTIAAGRD